VCYLYTKPSAMIKFTFKNCDGISGRAAMLFQVVVRWYYPSPSRKIELNWTLNWGWNKILFEVINFSVITFSPRKRPTINVDEKTAPRWLQVVDPRRTRQNQSVIFDKESLLNRRDFCKWVVHKWRHGIFDTVLSPFPLPCHDETAFLLSLKPLPSRSSPTNVGTLYIVEPKY